MLLFLASSMGHLLARAPWWDEGMYADVALSFRNFGHLGSSVVAPLGYMDWPDVHQYTYWQFPLYPVALGYWFRALPVGIVSMRLFSLLWGCIFVVAWFFLVRSLSRNEPLALLVASVVALDYETVTRAADGRMDMMCAALGVAGLASYFWFRESHWGRGVVFASWLGAAALFTHPLGLVVNVAIAAMVLWDWRRIRWPMLLIASLPYLIGTTCCLYYIRQAPDVFLAQSRAVFDNRVTGLLGTFRNIFNDFNERYIREYYYYLTGIFKVKILSLVFCAIGVAGLLIDSRLRSQPVARRVLLLAGIAYVGVAAIDNLKYGSYAVYSLPFLAACGGIWVYDCWQRAGFRRLFASGVLGAYLLVTICGAAGRVYTNPYRNLYEPAIVAIRNSLPPGGRVMGGSELAFELGFGPPLIDDRYLGYFSGVLPDVFAVSRLFYEAPARWSPRLIVAFNASRNTLRNQYDPIFQNADYKIYVRKHTRVLSPHEWPYGPIRR